MDVRNDATVAVEGQRPRTPSGIERIFLDRFTGQGARRFAQGWRDVSTLRCKLACDSGADAQEQPDQGDLAAFLHKFGVVDSVCPYDYSCCAATT